MTHTTCQVKTEIINNTDTGTFLDSLIARGLDLTGNDIQNIIETLVIEEGITAVTPELIQDLFNDRKELHAVKNWETEVETTFELAESIEFYTLELWAYTLERSTPYVVNRSCVNVCELDPQAAAIVGKNIIAYATREYEGADTVYTLLGCWSVAKDAFFPNDLDHLIDEYTGEQGTEKHFVRESICEKYTRVNDESELLSH